MTCIGKDPRCPCQDGDACHYKDCGGTKAWPVPQAEPVACRFCHSKKGCYTWLCYSCGEIDDVQQPAPPPVQEPVGKVVEINNDGFRCEFNRRLAVGTKLYTAPPLPAQPVQEPVAYVKGTYAGRLIYDTINPAVCLPVGMAFYNAPPQREWVGLTDEEVQFYALKHRQLVNAHYDAASDTNIITAAFEATVFYETVEQALKERNHG